MGVVWRAHDERLDRTVAVKQLLVRYGLTEQHSAETRRRAMREGRIAARLQHRNAIAMFDVAEHDGDPCLIMEFLASESLSAVLAERGSLPADEVAEIGAQAASALAAAHAVGIVHRDVKPGNILLADSGTVKITDFGISRALDDGTATTQTGMLAGTPAYLAPEIARGDEPTQASDVFSLGATLYHAVEGHPPFGTSSNPFALLHAVASGVVPPPVRAGALGPVLMRMLRRDPGQRPAMTWTAKALAAPESVPAPAAEVGTGAPPPPPTPVAPTPTPAGGTPVPTPARGTPVPTPAGGTPAPTGLTARHRRALLIVAMVVVLVASAVVVTLLNRNTDEPGTASGGAVTTTTEQAPTSEESTPPSLGELPADGDIAWSDAGNFVIDYYGTEKSMERRWRMLSVNGQAAFGTEEAFREYWSQFESVTSCCADSVTPNDDGSVNVPVEVTFVSSDGEMAREREVRVSKQGGQLLIDSEAR